MSTKSDFISLVTAHGTDTIYNRVVAQTPCPCRTPEGFRDPEWHLDHPAEPVCNEAGFLDVPVKITIKAFVQPIQSTRATRLSAEYIEQLFGEVEGDDHLGIFPESWGGVLLNFRDWGQSGEDYIGYDDRRFMVVNANLIPDPADGNPRHHWECGLRLISGVV